MSTVSKAVVAASLLVVGGFTSAYADADNDRQRKSGSVVSRPVPDIVRNGSTTRAHSVLWAMLQSRVET
ncbi:hypothetical protein [Microvirga antarctica]|uniref:hypothetical protein n=1 Tax=Microvirga antarctica TaxID=2819233 RepID=UPI001B30D4C3|nr:hypothetical protein [Microvirga antarctica]